jgi:hypothetical protein
MLSFQIKASHLHIGLKWLCQPEIGYTTPHFFQNQHTHYWYGARVGGSKSNAVNLILRLFLYHILHTMSS